MSKDSSNKNHIKNGVNMRLICPNCVAQYEVDQDVIPPEGRDVQCANCGHSWFQDSVQMFSEETAEPLGAGDPDSDVPPELFNDLEGKLSTPFASTRANVAPDPDGLEAEEPRDDFQIEQQPASPSSRMDPEALDMVREEAEYSSGEKPPAAQLEAPVDEPPATPGALNLDDILNDLPDLPDVEEPEITPFSDAPEQEQDEPETVAQDVDGADDDMDEIRRRIMELERAENTTAPSDISAPEQAVTENADDLDIPDLDPVEVAAPAGPAAETDNPFKRPVRNATPDAEIIEAAPEPAKVDDLYQENIPAEEPIDAEIAALISDQDDAEAAPKRSARKIARRAFPTDGTPAGALYDEKPTAAKDMFPDVDELTSELVHDAESTPEQPQEAKPAKVKSSGGFMRGFTLAILFFIIIGVLYFFAPVIAEYVPQAKPVLDIITQTMQQLIGYATPLIEQIKG